MAPSLTWTVSGVWTPTGADMSRSSVEATSEAARRGLAALSEPDLLEACLAGRPGAFDLVVERHRRAIYQLCYRFVSNHEDASDLSQEVFLRAYRGLGRFRGGSSLATWLHRIAVNVCLNHVAARKPANEPLEESRHVDVHRTAADDALLQSERAAIVWRAIGELPPRQRATLILRMYHDMSHQEIARTLGSSVGTVKANFFHALNKLKKVLGDEVK
jgi:RNA polymerase sigma-70 factor (ECF subfamily)